jgi:hypothetical protein
MTLLLKSSIEFVDNLPSASSSSSSSSSSSRAQPVFNAAKLATDLLKLFYSRIAFVAPPTVALEVHPHVFHDERDHDDDDDHVQCDAVGEQEDNEAYFAEYYDYDADLDAPHPADEIHEFSDAELHAFELADRFDRASYNQKACRSNRRAPKRNRRLRTGRVERTSVRTTVEAELVIAAQDAAVVTMPAPTRVARAPRSAAVAAEHNSWGSLRHTHAAATAEAARHIDAQFARAVGLSTAQLTALMTRDLSAADYELLLALDNAVAPKTIEADQLASLLRAVVAGDVASDDVCMICLDEMASATLSTLCKLPCKHVFHEACIREHLAKFSRRCPVDNLSLEQSDQN